MRKRRQKYAILNINICPTGVNYPSRTHGRNDGISLRNLLYTNFLKLNVTLYSGPGRWDVCFIRTKELKLKATQGLIRCSN